MSEKKDHMDSRDHAPSASGVVRGEAAAFTSGPWTAWTIEGSRFNVRGQKSVVCRLSIAPNSIHREEGLANARLISAAPDLLAALQAILHTYDDGGVPLSVAFRMANAAIAKALSPDTSTGNDRSRDQDQGRRS